MATDTAGDNAHLLLSICSIDDIFHHHLLPFLTHKEASRLERTSKSFAPLVRWDLLCQRDFVGGRRAAPRYSQNHQSFDALVESASWKENYQKWNAWKQWTYGAATALDMIQAIEIWTRIKAQLQRHKLHNVLESLCPPMHSLMFGIMKDKIPSSLAALYAVHGGQYDLPHTRPQEEHFFAGILGSYSCYNAYHSMRLTPAVFLDDAIHETNSGHKIIFVGLSPLQPGMRLYLRPTVEDPKGELCMGRHHRSAPLHVVGRGGILEYLRQYVEHLENGVYRPQEIVDGSPRSRGISLFPDDGELVSVCVTRGMEVRASARWFPTGDDGGLNFGYSIRMQMVERAEPCQLVGRHWAFMDGTGNVRRVDGEAVIGKQPLFFRDEEDDKPGFFDFGPAGDGNRYEDKVFVYQSQSGPVFGTTQEDCRKASVKGTFSFLPGSIASPTGPLFHVEVGEFPLKVPVPFY